MLEAVLRLFVAPLVVATLVTLILNRIAEGRKNKREYISTYIDEVRDEISALALLAVKYHFNQKGLDRHLVAHEIRLREADLRTRLVEVRLDDGRFCEPETTKVEIAEQNFISALTGGRFGASRGLRDDSQIRLIMASAVRLRRSLRELRLSRMAREPLDSVLASSLLIFFVSLLIFGAGVIFGRQDAVEDSPIIQQASHPQRP